MPNHGLYAAPSSDQRDSHAQRQLEGQSTAAVQIITDALTGIAFTAAHAKDVANSDFSRDLQPQDTTSWIMPVGQGLLSYLSGSASRPPGPPQAISRPKLILNSLLQSAGLQSSDEGAAACLRTCACRRELCASMLQGMLLQAGTGVHSLA